MPADEIPNAAPAAETLWVLSDLHLAPRSELLGFHAHAELAGLLDWIAAQPASTVVFNGDVFDFLQLPDYDGISLPLAARRTATILEALDDEPPATNVVRALCRLSAAGHRLLFHAGNHDPELLLAPVQALLAERLGATPVTSPTGSWERQVGRRRVVGLHGHADDPFNAIATATLLDAQRAGDAEVPMPPGSRLVRDVLNPYRRAQEADGSRRFAFLDLIPSELAVVLTLLHLDPRLAARRLGPAIGVSADALVRALARRLGLGQARLACPPAAPDATMTDLNGPIADLLVAAMEDAQQRAAPVMEQQLDAYLRQTPAARGPNMLAAGNGIFGQLFRRALATTLAGCRDAFIPNHRDALASRTLATWGGGDGIVAVTGHTHAARQIDDPAGGVYLNTGTWQDLAQPPADLSDAGIDRWLEQLRDGKIERWRRCPVARIDSTGAGLFHWNGHELETWPGH